MESDFKTARCERAVLAFAAGTASTAVLCAVLLAFDRAEHNARVDLQAKAAAPIVVAQATLPGASSPSLRR